MLLNTGRTPDFDSFIKKQDMRPIPIPRKAYKAEKYGYCELLNYFSCPFA